MPRTLRVFVSLVLCAAPAMAPSSSSSQAAQPGRSSQPTNPAQKPQQRAWGILEDAIKDENADKRAQAVQVLGLLPNNASAEELAMKALDDEKAQVREAAATALGEMFAVHALPKLREALNDRETSVVMASARALDTLKDEASFEVYYAILTGERKAGSSFVKEIKTFKDPKKLALFGFAQGIGFVPFAGSGVTVIKMMTKDDVSPIRAGAAIALARDKDPASGKALVRASADKSALVRAAALKAIAKRDDPLLLDEILSAMEDEKDSVRFAAAAAVVHLSEVAKNKAGISK